MQTSILSHLKHVGLSEKEIAAYIYLLSVESANPMELAKELDIKRSTVYVVLDELQKLGLVREIQRGKRFAYVAEDPERIQYLLEQLKTDTERELQSLKKIIPQLKATLRKKGEAPVVKFFEGEDAVQDSMQTLAENPKFRRELDYGVFSLELVYNLFRSKNLRQYIDLRLKENKKFKVIYTADEGEIDSLEGDQEAFKIDSKEYPLSCDISVFEDEVRFHMLGKSLYGVLIKNPELAETLTSLIKLAIKGAQK